jgi:hypothetical protein
METKVKTIAVPELSLSGFLCVSADVCLKDVGIGVFLCLFGTVDLVSSVYSVNRKHTEDLSSLLFESLRQNQTEMEFLNDKLAEVSGHKLASSQARVFVWFSTQVFLFYKMLFMNSSNFFVRGFSVWSFKTRVEYNFMDPPVEETVTNMEQNTRAFVEILSKNSISVYSPDSLDVLAASDWAGEPRSSLILRLCSSREAGNLQS